VGAGVFGLCFDDSSLVDAQCTLLRSLFQKLGSVHELEESLFDAFTALIGSGPAYVFYFMEGLIESGVTLGLARKEATEMVIRLFQGSVSLVESSDSRIGELREQVCSPAGTTITGVNELDRHAVRRSIIDAVTAAYRRSLEMN
jgi:pyrroline-5-carboxylate reductase